MVIYDGHSLNVINIVTRMRIYGITSFCQCIVQNGIPPIKCLAGIKLHFHAKKTSQRRRHLLRISDIEDVIDHLIDQVIYFI